MKYLKFKNSQLEASNIIMGCMRLNSLSVKEAQRHIETAVEAGINMFDHADIYGGGECEELFARAVKKEQTCQKIIEEVVTDAKALLARRK